MSCGCTVFRTCTGKIYDENWEYCIECGHRQLKGLRECPMCGDNDIDDEESLCVACLRAEEVRVHV